MNISREIKSVSIEEELQKSYLDYAMSVIIGRALPDVRDGLKPVHRRILFAMYILGNNYNKPYKKSARIVGDVIGKYHPHGDTAVYDSIVRMAQSFSLRYTLIDGQGNFGSIDGDSAAAMRYTEIRMSKISDELILDLDKETVDYNTNYDGTEQIPSVLPTRIPNLLINGSSGIAVGMATNIPPHNLTEVINACLAFIDNKDISLKEIMKYLPGPDFPTAAIIYGKKGIEDAYRTGKAKIYIRARIKIENDNKLNGRKSIVFYEIPYQVNKSKLIEKIASLVKEKKIEGIIGLRDESDKDGMRIVVDIKKDAIQEVVLNNLYSLTQLQISFGINMVALHNGKPKILPLKDILEAFIFHRREIVMRRSIFNLKKAYEKVHILEALTIALNNIDELINLIKKSPTSLEAKNKLIKYSWNFNKNLEIVNLFNKIKYKYSNLKQNKSLNNNFYTFTEKQAKSILDIKLNKLTKLEYNKIISEYIEIYKEISILNEIINDSNILMNVIKNELISIKNKYKDSRKTEIVSRNSDILVEDLIKKENVVVTLSYYGYVKYQPLKDYEAQRRGGRGKSAVNIKEKDFIYRLLIANTHDTILLFSNKGKTYWMKVYQLPESSRSARGRPIINLLPLSNKERITAILPVKKYDKNQYVFMATNNGIVKKTSLIEFSRPRHGGIIAIKLVKGDKLIAVDLTDGNNEIMLFSSYGKVVYFSEEQVRYTGRNAIGVKGINLTKGDKVVSLIIPRKEESILTVTKNGYGKRTFLSKYPIKSRSTQGVISIKVTPRNGEVIGAVKLNKKDQIILITDAGTLVRIRAEEINTISRNTQGVRLIRTQKKEKVVALQRIIKLIIDKEFLIL